VKQLKVIVLMAAFSEVCDGDSVRCANNNNLQIPGATEQTSIESCSAAELHHADGMYSECLQFQQTDTISGSQDQSCCMEFSESAIEIESAKHQAARKDLQERLEVVLEKLTIEQTVQENENTDCVAELACVDLQNGGNFLQTHSSAARIEKHDHKLVSGNRLTVNSSVQSEEHIQAISCDCNLQQIPKDMDEVGRYAYITLVAHSMFMLFDYAKWHR
jgi:hypothetical protein